MDSNHRSPARKSRFLLRKANCGTERGQPKRVVSCGTDGSNPSPSSRESAANLTSEGIAGQHNAMIAAPYHTAWKLCAELRRAMVKHRGREAGRVCRGRERKARHPVQAIPPGHRAQFFRAPSGHSSRRDLLARLTLNPGKHAGNEPARLAHLDDGYDRAIVVQGDEGPAQVVRLGHRWHSID
jgi:hypothetical protein